jgi:hypothetical protein
MSPPGPKPPADPKERRKKPRLPRRLPVRFGTETRMMGGTIVDVSEGGMRVESPETFPVHSVLIVFVQFPRHAVRLRARVAWSGGSGEGGMPAMGLTFTQAEPALAKAYKEWLAELKLMASEAAQDAGPGARATRDPGLPVAAPEARGDEGAAADRSAAEPPGPVRRRLESRQGQAYDVLLEPLGDGWRLTVFQLPRQAGVSAPDLQSEHDTYAAAQKALTDFVRTH